MVALVRDPARAGHLRREHVTLVVSDLSSVPQLTAQMKGADALIHAAGMYVVGIKKSQRQRMWDANVGTTERVLDAAIAAGVPRIVYVSTVNIFGDTHGKLPDETYRARPGRGLPVATTTRPNTALTKRRKARIAAGAPIVIVLPSQVYGPNDHSLRARSSSRRIHGKLRYAALASLGLAWVHVDDLADGIVAALDRGKTGESYMLAGDPRRLSDAIAVAAQAGVASRPPRCTCRQLFCASSAPLMTDSGGLPGMPANLREVISAGDGVTYWASHDKATRELGFNPRNLEQGITDTWGRGNADQSRRGR